MKILKKRTCNSTIRQVVNDEKSEVLAIVGQIGDLLDEGLISGGGCSRDTWLCIPGNIAQDPILERAGMGETRAEAIQNTIF